ncbi:MAG: response regulator transcription factor [Clostridiales bacterium]|nr:response regulator transcription factor [Clostridiales bacterium]MDU3239350.1 response regulator transcription factor [Clostridiales bacterium]
MNIIIIDDDQLVALSLKTILESDPEIKVTAVGSSGKDAILLFEKYQTETDILLMDIRMAPMSGLEAGEKILKQDPLAKILYLTTFSDDEYIVRALHIGAKGYLLKQNYESILPALKAVYSGQSVFGGEIVRKIPELMQNTEHYNYSSHGILPKELEIIKLVADVLSNKEISETLYLSEGTVRNYLSTILDKLDLRDRTQLAIFFYQHRG